MKKKGHQERTTAGFHSTKGGPFSKENLSDNGERNTEEDLGKHVSSDIYESSKTRVKIPRCALLPKRTSGSLGLSRMID